MYPCPVFQHYSIICTPVSFSIDRQVLILLVLPKISIFALQLPRLLWISRILLVTVYSGRVQITGDFAVNKAKFLFSLMPLYTTLTGTSLYLT